MENPATHHFVTAERLICKLRDVLSCDIQVEPNGTISAIHVTARAGRTPKQIARDVEAILAAEEGVQVDHRKISIAQYGETATAPRRGLERLSVQGVTLHESPHGFEAEVTLAAGGAQATGRASGGGTRYESRRVVAQATIGAISNLVNADPALSLGELEERELGSRRVVLVCVNRTQGREEVSLFGTSEIRYDSTRAVIYSVLDAVNRVLGSLEPREPVEYEIGPAPIQ